MNEEKIAFPISRNNVGWHVDIGDGERATFALLSNAKKFRKKLIEMAAQETQEIDDFFDCLSNQFLITRLGDCDKRIDILEALYKEQSKLIEKIFLELKKKDNIKPLMKKSMEETADEMEELKVVNINWFLSITAQLKMLKEKLDALLSKITTEPPN